MNPAAAPVTVAAEYFSDHTALPVSAFKQVTTSSPPCRVKMYILSLNSTGDATPSPT